MNDFNYASVLAHSLYGIELDETDFEELALTAYRMIGNKRMKLYRYVANIDCKDLTVKLPCNCDEIEAITYFFEDYNYVTPTKDGGDADSFNTEHYIEAMKVFPGKLYSSGRYVKFERVGDTLYFDRNYGKVSILYKGEQLSDDGLPSLTEKEANACAAFVAFATLRKQGIIARNQNLLQMAEGIRADWLRYCDAARVDEHISQNEMNEILDAKSSWDRKIYNKSYKPAR